LKWKPEKVSIEPSQIRELNKRRKNETLKEEDGVTRQNPEKQRLKAEET